VNCSATHLRPEKISELSTVNGRDISIFREGVGSDAELIGLQRKLGTTSQATIDNGNLNWVFPSAGFFYEFDTC
jgi:hypothetical protein